MTLRNVALVLGLWPAFVVGQVTIGPEGPKRPAPPPGQPQPAPQDAPQLHQLHVTPAAEPLPALKYRFDVPANERRPGNSVPFYYRAVLEYQQKAADARKKLDDLHTETSDLPLKQFPVEKAREVLATFSFVYNELERASTCEETDWSWRLEQLNGLEAISFLLPEIQESRSLGRMLTVKARLELVEGRYGDAVRTLRVGYALGRAVAKPPILICGLVGIAISSQMDAAVLDWIGEPGSPNVYWAVAVLPDPHIDLRPAMEYELSFASRFAPWLATVESDNAPAAVWRYRATKLFEDMRGFTDMTMPQEVLSLAVTGLALRSYPAAKRALLNSGYDAARVESMPVGQVIAIRQKQVDELIADELLKESFVSSTNAVEVGERAEKAFKTHLFDVSHSGLSNEPFPLMSLLAPATRQSTQSSLRLQTRQAGLRAVEAIRLHVAATGTLPDSLDDIQAVPVPVNPSDGKPFAYRVEGKTAVLEVNVRGGYPTRNWRIELSFAEPTQQK